MIFLFFSSANIFYLDAAYSYLFASIYLLSAACSSFILASISSVFYLSAFSFSIRHSGPRLIATLRIGKFSYSQYFSIIFDDDEKINPINRFKYL